MEETKSMEDIDAYMGWLEEMLDLEDDDVVPNERMEHLLVALAKVQVEAQAKAAPFQAVIEAEQAKMAKAITGLDIYEARIKAGIWECLEVFFEEANCTFEGEIGKAQIVRPKNRISYDINGLETLRKSSDEVERMIGHLRDESPSKPYLKVKLK